MKHRAYECCHLETIVLYIVPQKFIYSSTKVHCYTRATISQAVSQREKKTNNVVPGYFKFEILCVCASGLLSFFSSVNKFCFGYSLMCILKSIICPMCIHVFFVPEGSFPLFHLRERNSHWLSREIESDLASRIQSSQDIILYSFFFLIFSRFHLVHIYTPLIYRNGVHCGGTPSHRFSTIKK